MGVLAVGLVIAASCVVAPGAAPDGVASADAASVGAATAKTSRLHGTNAERVATHTYLIDQYEYAQAITEAAPAAVAAYEGAVSKIAGECPSALAGVPQESIVGISEAKLTARQRGESKRRQAQLLDLQSEIDSALAVAEQTPLGQARAALLAKLKALPPGGPALTQAVRADAVGLEEDLRVEVPDACADVKVWVASGYRALSPASRALAQREEARFPELLRRLASKSPREPLSSAEDSADRALARKTAQLELGTAHTVASSLDSAHKRLEAALGLDNRKREVEPVSPEPKASAKIAAGRTAAGSKYTVWLERKKNGSTYACKVGVEVKTAQQAGPTIVGIITSGESEICLAPSKDRSEPSVKCSEGLLTIEAAVLSATRTVALRMSSGAQIVSRPVLVPHRLGGPAAFYYQAVRGPSPIPVSLIERDAHGRTLRVVKLRRIVGCSKHPLKYLPGGKRTLVRGQAPQGPDFSILGERYRLFGRIHIQLKLKTGEGLVNFGEGEEGGPLEGSGESFAMPVKSKGPLDSELATGCRPHEYSIFYGLLEKPRDTVFAKITGKLVPLRRVHIPASLHTGGVLVYLVSSAQPEEIVVRSPDGKTVMSEDRASRATEGRETCEGESEGPSGPPPGALGGIGGETSKIVLHG
jgi:hypothetical protein